MSTYPRTNWQLSFNYTRCSNLPEASKDGLHQVQYAGLPEFLAASADGDRYLELARQDVIECIKSHSKVCRFRTPIAKSDAKKSCVLALFKKDEQAQNKICKTEISEWKGSRVIYLDQRRWALSDVKEQDLLIACPKKASQMKKLPRIGVFEIPMGCEAKTNEWIFPSNRQVDTYLPPDHDPSSLPPLHIFQDIRGLTATAAKGVIQLHQGNDSVLERSKQVF